MPTSTSRRHLSGILRAGKDTWQTTTTWKSSNAPQFIAKMQRVLALYDDCPADGRVICADEFGPLNLTPRKGKRWRPAASPARLRATCNRYFGVMHMITALDPATGRLYYASASVSGGGNSCPSSRHCCRGQGRTAWTNVGRNDVGRAQ
ncbi:hypothetical protein [Nonomuraea turcica]|uniref:hypothetical protein n=1 Tax=Nonomuraea sp. G32 TaxID=3067274 RepID=UPI00273C68DD|nr:hypothetical protein [Nonomuraea sp. G32]MDP4505838.1 hypothetical protein [Nonomuraea sp. G32]